MPYSLGPNITRTGLVFAYDTGDQTNSYKGQPITNQFSVQGSSGFGSGADNVVAFPIQGTPGFIRLGFGQTFGGYTIQQNDVVYKYNLNQNIGGCHYHGMTAAIPAGVQATFTFDYYISPDTDFSTGNDTLLANFENYGGGALGGGVNMPNYAKGVWQTVSFNFYNNATTTSPGTQAMFLYPGGCGGNIATNGYILYRNPQVVWLNYTVPFVQGTRSTTQGLLDISGNNNTITLANMTYGANNALSFDGTDDYTSVANSSLFKSNDITVELVIKFNSFKASDLVQFGVGSGTYSQWYFRDLGNGNFNWFIWGSGLSVYSNLEVSRSSLTTGKYYHIVCTTAGGVTTSAYYNATLAGTAGTTAYTTAPSWTPAAMTIGGFSWDGYSNTNIPVCKVYNRTLSSAEILQNYNSYKTRFNIT
jgi:hypothetical protein